MMDKGQKEISATQNNFDTQRFLASFRGVKKSFPRMPDNTTNLDYGETVRDGKSYSNFYRDEGLGDYGATIRTIGDESNIITNNWMQSGYGKSISKFGRRRGSSASGDDDDQKPRRSLKKGRKGSK